MILTLSRCFTMTTRCGPVGLITLGVVLKWRRSKIFYRHLHVTHMSSKDHYCVNPYIILISTKGDSYRLVPWNQGRDSRTIGFEHTSFFWSLMATHGPQTYCLCLKTRRPERRFYIDYLSILPNSYLRLCRPAIWINASSNVLRCSV